MTPPANPPPPDPPMVPVAVVGTVGWAAAAAVMAAARAPEAWLRTCLAGALVGLPGIALMVLRDRRRTRRRAGQDS